MRRQFCFGIGLLVLAISAAAAPIRMDFSGSVTSASGVLAGTTGLVEGYFVYDDTPTPEAVQPSLGYYIFTGSPYRFQVTVPALGLLESDSISVLVSDDGRYTVTYPDPIDMLSIRTGAVPTTVVPAVSVTFYWTADTGAFSGDGIPTISETLAMGPPSLAVYPYGDPHYILTAQALSQVAFTVVPLPATAWLLSGGLISLARLCRRRSDRGTRAA